MEKRTVILTIGVALILALCSLIPAPAFSREGMIAYSRLTGGHWQIWIMDPGGGSNTQLTRTPIDKRSPTWSDNGKRLAYRTNNGELWVINREEGREYQILKRFGNITDPALSPDGERIAFVRFRPDLVDETDIWTIDLNGENPRRLTNDQGLQYNPAWSPKGKGIVFVSEKGSESHEIWIMDKEGGNRVQLTRNKAYDIRPAWSPNGRRIAFATNRTGNYDIWVMKAKGKRPRRLTGYEGLDTSPTWSPDRRKIAFVSNRGGDIQIWVMKADGSHLRQLTGGEGESLDPAWTRGR